MLVFRMTGGDDLYEDNDTFCEVIVANSFV